MPHGGEGKGLPIHRISGEMRGDSPQRSCKRLLLRSGAADARGTKDRGIGPG